MKRILICILSFCLVTIASSAWGATHFVSTSGTDGVGCGDTDANACDTLSYTIANRISAGDTILGKCTDDFGADPINLAADDNSQDTLTFSAYDGSGGAEAESTCSGSTRPKIIVSEDDAVDITGDYIDALTIKNWWLVTQGSGNDCRGIDGRSVESSNWTFDNLDIDSVNDGIRIIYTHTFAIIDSHITNTAGAGIEIYGVNAAAQQAQNGTITNGVVNATGGSEAITIHRDDAGVKDKPGDIFTIRWMELYGASEDGVDSVADHTTVEFCHIHDNGTGLNMGHGADDSILRFNLIEDNDVNSISYGCTDDGNDDTWCPNTALASHNIIKGQYDNGVRISGSTSDPDEVPSDITIINNTFINTGSGLPVEGNFHSAGMYVIDKWNGTGLLFKNNIVYSSNTDEAGTTDDILMKFANTDGNGGANATSLSLLDNLYYHTVESGDAGNIFLDEGTARTLAWIQANYSEDAGAEDDNPDFVNPASDWTLQVGSPGIDTGTDLGATYDDGIDPSSSLPPSTVDTLDQDLHGDGWEKGAFIYNDPQGTASIQFNAGCDWN